MLDKATVPSGRRHALIVFLKALFKVYRLANV